MNILVAELYFLFIGSFEEVDIIMLLNMNNLMNTCIFFQLLTNKTYQINYNELEIDHYLSNDTEIRSQ